MIASAPAAKRQKFLDALTAEELLSLPYLFRFWAMEHQLPPKGLWRTWVVLGGRGAGKTRAGAEWVRSMLEGARPDMPGKARRIALVGETFDQVREVMVFGDSGILACSPPDRRPHWSATRRMLIWPNNAQAMAFSAHEPEALRGPQFDGAWSDELAKWKKAGPTWDMLQFALRLGDDPRQCVTTTPRNLPLLKAILDLSSTVSTHAATDANRANLAASFLAEVHARYDGTRLGRQELDGLILDEIEGALWSRKQFETARTKDLAECDRIVVAVDPPVSGHAGSDECGIVIVGAIMSGVPNQWRAVVLDDASIQGATSIGWAEEVIRAYNVWNADRIVVEVNQGGDLVETVIRQVDALCPITKVHATKSKGARAEPVAALYEQNRVEHRGIFAALEDQMCLMTREGYQGDGSPDRADALVWALTELLLIPAGKWRRPRLRTL